MVEYVREGEGLSQVFLCRLEEECVSLLGWTEGGLSVYMALDDV